MRKKAGALYNILGTLLSDQETNVECVCETGLNFGKRVNANWSCSVLPFQPKYRLAHPENNYFFIIYKHIFWMKVSKITFYLILKTEALVMFGTRGCMCWHQVQMFV